MQGSSCTSMSSTQMWNVKNRMQKDAVDMKDCLLIMPGYGVSLEAIGQEDTVKITDAVKAGERQAIV